MDLPGVSIADTNDSSLFSLGNMKKQKVRYLPHELKCMYVELNPLGALSLPSADFSQIISEWA